MAIQNGAQKVYIVNRSNHDFSRAERFGELCYLSEGLVQKRNVNYMARLFTEKLVDSTEKDFILPTALTIMSMVAALVFAQKHGRVNLLLFESGRYKARTLVLDGITELCELVKEGD
jgi:hypothetical protein